MNGIRERIRIGTEPNRQYELNIATLFSAAFLLSLDLTSGETGYRQDPKLGRAEV